MNSFLEYLEPRRDNLVLTGVLFLTFWITMIVLTPLIQLAFGVSVPDNQQFEAGLLASPLIATILAAYLQSSVALYWIRERF